VVARRLARVEVAAAWCPERRGPPPARPGRPRHHRSNERARPCHVRGRGCAGHGGPGPRGAM